MAFTSVKTYQFRNLEDAEVDTDTKVIYLVGPNGQGKTNFLESIYILSFGSSFRTVNNGLLVKQGTKEMSLFGEFSENSGMPFTVGIQILDGKKQIKVDGKIVRDRKEMVQNIPCIVFAHEDINFVKGSPEERRFFFNQTMSLLKPAFIDSLRKYNKVLRMRNIEIKEGNLSNLDIYDIQLSDLGLQIQRERKELTEEFNQTFNEIYRQIDTESDDDGKVRIQYNPSWKERETGEEVMNLLREKRNIDRDMGFTTSGPHRDRFVFRKAGKNFSLTASTGQFRLAALTLRVAQALFCSKKTGRKPVLLLDDVLLELDGKKKEAFLRTLPEFEQAFFTFLPEEDYGRFSIDGDVSVYSVSRGKLVK